MRITQKGKSIYIQLTEKEAFSLSCIALEFSEAFGESTGAYKKDLKLASRLRDKLFDALSGRTHCALRQ